jgi:hypothetical protein
LSTDPRNETTGFSRSDLQRAKRFEMHFWTTRAEEAEAAGLAKRLKALIRRRGRTPDGATVEIHIEDRRTGRVY